jgi:nitrite reductase (NADH) large subunit
VKSIVIIGASAAGHTAAMAVREAKKEAPVTLITQEKYPFYDKRKLWDYLSGKAKEKDVLLCDEDSYRHNAIEFIKESKVSNINTDKKILYFKNRESISYGLLAICSGKKVELPEIPGSRKEGVFRLYSLEDFKKFISYMAGDTLCVVGSGLMALRIAKTLALRNKEITLISAGAQPPLDTATETGRIEVVQGALIEIIGESQAQAVKLETGKIIGVSAVIFAQELKGSVDFLKYTDVETKGEAIIVDSSMRTNIKDVFAAGSVSCRSDGQIKADDWGAAFSEGQLLAAELIAQIAA